MKKEKKPGRVTLKCVKCGAEFSTHSSNRDHCYACKQKCYEIHRFDEGANAVHNRKENNEKTEVAENPV